MVFYKKKTNKLNLSFLAKVCPFYQHQNLLDTVLSISKPRMPQSPSDWGRILFLLKGKI